MTPFRPPFFHPPPNPTLLQRQVLLPQEPLFPLKNSNLHPPLLSLVQWALRGKNPEAGGKREEGSRKLRTLLRWWEKG